MTLHVEYGKFNFDVRFWNNSLEQSRTISEILLLIRVGLFWDSKTNFWELSGKVKSKDQMLAFLSFKQLIEIPKWIVENGLLKKFP